MRTTARGERPPAPWGSFPLVELVVLIGIGFLIGGFIVAGNRGAIMIGTGMALASLAGLEISIREHFAGYRSHTTILAAAPAIGALVALSFLAQDLVPASIRPVVAAVIFALAFFGLREVFKRRSGGLSFRVGGFGG